MATGGGAAIFASSPTGDVMAQDDVIAGDDIVLYGGAITSGGASTQPLFIDSNSGIHLTRNSDLDEAIEWFTVAGRSGVQLLLDENGNLSVSGTFVAGGADLAEYYPTVEPDLARRPGSVVALDPGHPGHVRSAERGASNLVLGIVSTLPGLALGGGDVDGQRADLFVASQQAYRSGDVALGDALRQQWTQIERDRTDRVPLALSGRVPVRVDRGSAPIAVGDRVGLGRLPGQAARFDGAGPVIGIALEPWSGLAETVEVFVRREAAASPSQAAAAAAPSGSGIIPRGARSVVIEHPGLGPDSMPVVTFYGHPGSLHWVSGRGYGSFLLNLSDPAPEDIAYGYQVISSPALR